jgi:hypothetical protein
MLRCHFWKCTESARFPTHPLLDDLNAAEKLFRDALDLFPYKMAHANLGEIYKRREQFDRDGRIQASAP